MSQQVNPCEFGVIINETDIIIVPAHRAGGWTPYIRKDKFESSLRHTNKLWKMKLMVLCLLTRITNHIIGLSSELKIITNQDSLNCGIQRMP
jgi:hypothetical protein